MPPAGWSHQKLLLCPVVKDFSPQGLHPTRETAAARPWDLFSHSSQGVELNYLQLTDAQTSHKFTSKQDPAREEGFCSI